MRKLAYLFDASSVVRAIKEIRLAPLSGQALQWLTVYEVINALWKEVYLLHKLDVQEAASLVNVFTKLIREMVILDPSGLEQDILRIAVSRGITVYDASYVALAIKRNLVLVTEDQKLSRKVSGVVNVVSLDNLT